MLSPHQQLLEALTRAEAKGKRVVCRPSHRGWDYEAWRDDEGRICWRENLGSGPEGPRGPIRYDEPPKDDDLFGWIVTAT